MSKDAFLTAAAVLEQYPGLFDGPASLYRAARGGLLPVVRVGRRVRFSAAGLAEFLAGGGRALPGGWRREPVAGQGEPRAAR